MLPRGLSAHAAPPAEVAALRRMLPEARTAGTVVAGACSCDLVRPRLADPREDERHLRSRYFAMGLPRSRIVGELERHRRSADPPDPAASRGPALASFVAEHARNAGPTLYHLGFGPASHLDPPDPARLRTRAVAEVLERPGDWLQEGYPTLVVRQPGGATA